MKPLSLTLQDDTEAGMLPALAKFWKVAGGGLDRQALIAALREAMLEAAQTERVWDSLSDPQRGALQMLAGSGGKMPLVKFERLFGSIRQMGAAQIEREKPLENPANVAEALYYRGLIAQTFEMAETGPRVTVYIPEDLARALPMKRTSYPDLKPDPEAVAALQAQMAEQPPLVEPLDAADVSDIRPADTSLVDDLTTLLAHLQLHAPLLDGERLSAADRDVLRTHLLKPDEERLDFLLHIALSADLVEVQAGKAFPKRAETRRWLSSGRAAQVQALAEAWKTSRFYRDLWQVPGLHFDPGGELDKYDADAVRAAILSLMGEIVPRQEWWSLEAFIAAVKESEPDFQRPGGDYESWFIRDDDDTYLTGFENWDAVEGALLEFVASGPMHWLGLLDSAEDAARLTAYGRALLGQAAWPSPPETEDKVVVKDDGTLLISRKVPRVDRFQAMRFTTWVAAGDPYTYKLDALGIQRAAEQGINTGHIASFLSRALGDAPIPGTVARLLENWKAGPSAAVSLERLLVLRTTAPETLDRIYDTPALRRYLGARLGPMAVVVRADQWEALRSALGEQGIQVEVLD